MSGFARGKYAYGISDRSGVRYKLNRMKREWNGSLVGPDEYEPKQPQLFSVGVPNVLEKTFTPVKASTQVGTVTVVIT